MVLPLGSESWQLGVHVYSAIATYLIHLLMRSTLKVLKCVNHHLHSSQKITNETGKTLCDYF